MNTRGRTRFAWLPIGVVVSLTGAALMIALLVIVYGTSEEAHVVVFRLGLALPLLISLLAQTLMIVGLVFIWRAVRPSRRPARRPRAND